MIRLLFLLLVLAWPQVGQAGFLDNLACVNDGSCGLEEVVLGLVFLIRLMLGGMGAVALIYFVIGGLEWLTSSGAPDKVKKGRDIMMNTVFALALAFSSYIILDFFVNKVLGVKPGFTGIKTAPIGTCGQDVRAEGQICGLPMVNMVCYKGVCTVKCDVRALQTGELWHCADISTAPVGTYTEGVNMVSDSCLVTNGATPNGTCIK